METASSKARRKKVCPNCGRKLWLRDFYKLKSGAYASWCNDCQRANKREWYNRTRKVPDGIRKDAKTDLLIEHRGISRRIYWSRRMLDDLIRLFPTTMNEDMADILGVSVRTLIRKARELGLRKDPVWLRGIWEDHRRLARFESRRKGYPGGFQDHPERGMPYRFKKGHQLTPEQKAKQRESMIAWYRRNPGAAKKKSEKLNKGVRCVETGEAWPSIGEACRSVGVSRGYFSHYLNDGKPLRGLHYEFIKPLKQQNI